MSRQRTKKDQEIHWRRKATMAQRDGVLDAAARYVANADALCDDPARLGTMLEPKNIRITRNDYEVRIKALEDELKAMRAR